MRARPLAWLLLPLGLAAADRASADENDVLPSRFVTPAAPDFNGHIPLGAATPDQAAQTRFRSLASELGVVLAPRLLAPADTIGFGGFQFSVDVAFTSIAQNADYWDAAERVDPQNPRANRPPSFMGTLGVFVRKGLWLPLPSFEIGAGAVHMQDSNLWALQGYAKLALQEGFHDTPLPSLAVRGAASRLTGSPEIDLTVASLDVSISKSFGLAGTATLTPYAGWNLLWIIPRGQVLDASPWCDAFRPTTMGTDASHPCVSPGDQTDLNSNFVYPRESNIRRQRVFVGAKLKFYVLALLGEWEYVPAGSSVDHNAGSGSAAAVDRSTNQQTIAISAALDF